MKNLINGGPYREQSTRKDSCGNGGVIAGGVTIYFGARFVYDISTKP